MQRIGKMVLIYTMHSFSRALNFPTEMLSKNPQVHILFHVSCFESAMYGKIHTRKFNFPHDQIFVLVVWFWVIFLSGGFFKYAALKSIKLSKCAA